MYATHLLSCLPSSPMCCATHHCFPASRCMARSLMQGRPSLGKRLKEEQCSPGYRQGMFCYRLVGLDTTKRPHSGQSVSGCRKPLQQTGGEEERKVARRSAERELPERNSASPAHPKCVRAERVYTYIGP
ncbi:hypothetical protein B0H12DRAFT_219596 [Mycena haematopus]|nr:hypothetical protein B0H12DRAFT_219596 [Mycena haematopus]